MCGITAYLGTGSAVEVVLTGLRRLEYRGYDSAGVAVQLVQPDGTAPLSVTKRVGKVENTAASVTDEMRTAHLGIGHTRWATHGPPSDVNAHPHLSQDRTFAVVHNGIIENYATLRSLLEKDGFSFASETDTEVLSMLLQQVSAKHPTASLTELVKRVLLHVEGAYGIVVISSRHPGVMVGARHGSPLLLGVGEGEFVLASDACAVLDQCARVVYLEDGDIATVSADGYQLSDAAHDDLVREVHEIRLSLEEIEKGGHKHFMIKEILDQPRTLQNCIRGRVDAATGAVVLGGLRDVMDRIAAAKRIIICACGTSWHAGLVGEYLIEKYARTVVEVEYASEFIYRDPVLEDGDVVVVISQSGETADTLAAAKLAKQRGCLVLGFVNVVGSSIARATDAGVYMHAGPEIGVASTKAFTAQLSVLIMFALALAERKGATDVAELRAVAKELAGLPGLVERTLAMQADIRSISREYKLAAHFLYLGRGMNFPVALEGCLKLKEISYIHAEGYPAAEMKHGPIALIDPLMPVVFIASRSDPNYRKIVNNVQEVLSRKGSIIVVTEESNHDFDATANHVLRFPEACEPLVPILAVIPLQLLAYHVADMRGCAIDQPRNLAKSVTVE